MEVSDRAIAILHTQTAGHPYYSKLICRELFKIMVSRRDAHVTDDEIAVAVRTAVAGTASNSFMHFWKDAVLEIGERAEEVSVNRRKVLLALAEMLRQTRDAREQDIVTQAKGYELSAELVEHELRDFVRRRILTDSGGRYACKVPFFQEWLKERGISEIITTFADLNAILAHKRDEESLFVRSDEVAALAATWGTYRGSKVTEDQIRAWLGQFGENRNQRTMFSVLRGLKFYTADTIRQKMKEAYGIVIRGTIQ